MRTILGQILAWPIILISPAIPLLIVWARWNGRENWGWIEFHSREFYPQCRSRSGFIAIALTMVSLIALPLYILAAVITKQSWEWVPTMGLLLAQLGVVTSLFAERGVRAPIFLAANICAFWWLVLDQMIFLLILMVPPAVPLLVIWARWNGRENWGWIELCSSEFYPECKSTAGAISSFLTLVSLIGVPIYLLLERIPIEGWKEGFPLVGLFSALLGMIAGLFARRGVRAMTFVSSMICVFWWLALGTPDSGSGTD